MSGKIVDIPALPGRDEAARAEDAWVRGRSRAGPGGALKRLTVEVDAGLHRRLRVLAAMQGCTMAAVVRGLIDGACPE